jgi:hypothetical protein
MPLTAGEDDQIAGLKLDRIMPGEVQPHMVDPGTPLGASKTVSAEGVSDAGPGAGVGGYSLIKADDLDAAVGLVKNHPFVARGGTLRVSEPVAP